MRSLAILILAAAPMLPLGAAAELAPPLDDDPGTGALLARTGGGLVPMPLASMTVALRASGPVVRAEVLQRFENPTGDTLEAVYLFPLPEGAAVDELTLEVGGSTFRGEIREREDARRVYETAKAQGKGAGLVEQHRPNVFRTSVANIPPRSTVTIRVGFLDEASWDGRSYATVFPLKITPRYASPLGPKDPAVGISRPAAAIPNAVIHADIDSGVPLLEVTSPSHPIRVTEGRGVTHVEVGDGSVPTDRDVVLRWRPRAEALPVAGALVEDSPNGRFAIATLIPPDPDGPAARGFPTQTVFVVDVSGSMEGPSIEQARGALTAALDRLGPADTFAMIKFNDANEAFAERLLPADARSVDAAKAWVSSLRAGGGTEILPALVRALDLSERGDPSAFRRVILITDGAVSNEEQVLAEVRRHLGGSRLHVVGIGYAPNRWLMKELARAGRGAFESIGSRAEVASRTLDLLARTSGAVLTDVALEWTGAPPLDADPDPVPDLYPGRPLVVVARLDPSKPPPKLRVWGKAPGGPVTMEVDLRDARPDSGIGVLWARRRVEALEEARMHGADPAGVRADVVELATRFRLVTPYTSFVVVTDEEHALADRPVPIGSSGLPEGGTVEPLLSALGVAGVLGGGLLVLAAARSATRSIA